MALRGPWRLFLLFIAVMQGLTLFLAVWLPAGGRPSRRRRAEWLHRSCIRILRHLDLAVEVTGPLPSCGLVVSNHLSHLDILLYSAAMPCIFVSKVEVKSWPFFGRAAKYAGTVFVDRQRTTSSAEASAALESLLKGGVPVILFAESTTTDGSTVLAFRPTFFEPAVRAAAPITAAALAYCVPEAHAESEVCFYGEDQFGPHLLKTLRLSRLNARLTFAATSRVYPDRKQAASDTWQQTTKLRQSLIRPAAVGGESTAVCTQPAMPG